MDRKFVIIQLVNIVVFRGDKLSSINNDTFDVFFAEDDIILLKEFIKQLFLDEYVIREENLIDQTKKSFSNISPTLIFKALDELIKNKEIVYDGYKKMGYIISVFDYYIFQPSDISDTNISVKYRYLPNVDTKKLLS